MTTDKPEEAMTFGELLALIGDQKRRLTVTDCVPVADWHDRQDRKSDWKRHFPAPLNDASDHQSVLTTHQRSSPLPVYQ